MSKHFVGSRLHRASHRSVLINRTTAIVLFAIVLAMNYGPLRTGRFFRILGESSERRLLSIGKAVFGFHLGINLGIHLENIQVERIHMSERSSSWKVSTRQTLKLALNPNSKSIWSFKWSEKESPPSTRERRSHFMEIRRSIDFWMNRFFWISNPTKPCDLLFILIASWWS